LDFIPIGKKNDKDKIIKVYGKSFSEDEIRAIMGREIPPEWTVNLSALGEEPWRFKDLEDQLNMYRQQWQADQQKQSIAKMAGKMPGKTNEGKRKINDRIHSGWYWSPQGRKGTTSHSQPAFLKIFTVRFQNTHNRGGTNREQNGQVASVPFPKVPP
jgi:hypothetical protein